MVHKNRLFTQRSIAYLPANQAVATNTHTLFFLNIGNKWFSTGIGETEYPDLMRNGSLALPVRLSDTDTAIFGALHGNSSKIANTLSEQESV